MAGPLRRARPRTGGKPPDFRFGVFSPLQRRCSGDAEMDSTCIRQTEERRKGDLASLLELGYIGLRYVHPPCNFPLGKMRLFNDRGKKSCRLDFRTNFSQHFLVAGLRTDLRQMRIRWPSRPNGGCCRTSGFPERVSSESQSKSPENVKYKSGKNQTTTSGKHKIREKSPAVSLRSTAAAGSPSPSPRSPSWASSALGC